jgi:hypothetical protein
VAGIDTTSGVDGVPDELVMMNGEQAFRISIHVSIKNSNDLLLITFSSLHIRISEIPVSERRLLTRILNRAMTVLYRERFPFW